MDRRFAQWAARLAFALSLGAGACATPPAPAPPDAGRALLSEALEILRSRALAADTVDWSTFEAELALPEPATTADAHAAIERAIARLGDPHTRLIRAAPPASAAATAPAPSEATGATEPVQPAPQRRVVPTEPAGRMLDGGIAYLVVPMCPSIARPELEAYARALRTVVCELQAQAPAGWIAELRFDGGGNMWPMLVGLRPLIGEGELGGAMGRAGIDWTFGCTGNEAWIEYPSGRAPQVSIDAPDCAPVAAATPIALLVGPWTMSSGEIVVTSFAGLPNVRSFGEATAGLTTTTDMEALSDGSTLIVATARVIDRTGRVVAGALAPDVAVAFGDWPEEQDAASRAAQRWVLERSGSR